MFNCLSEANQTLVHILSSVTAHHMLGQRGPSERSHLNRIEIYFAHYMYSSSLLSTVIPLFTILVGG